MAAKRRVMIVGGGLGGATLALALIKRGFSVRVFEQMPVLLEQGAGLTVPGNAMRVFKALGIWERVRDISVWQAGGPFVHYATGEILTGIPDYDWVKKPQNTDQLGHTHRGALHMLLAKAIQEIEPDAFVLGHRLKTFTQNDSSVSAEFENGATAEGDMLVGCDGLLSAAQKTMFGERAPRFTGVVAIRVMIPADTVQPYLTGGRFINYVGPTSGFLRYGVMGGTLINCVALVRTDKFQGEGWNNRSSREELLEFYRDFHPDVIGLINNAPEDGIFKWALYDRDPLPLWSRGRATLLGDAAHPMLPFLGQGATMAIEDGIVLARALEAYDDAEKAFAAYEAVRRPRTTQIMEASRRQGEALTQPDPSTYKGGETVNGIDRNYDASTVPV